jgi:hypothetical protein
MLSVLSVEEQPFFVTGEILPNSIDNLVASHLLKENPEKTSN